MLDSRETSFCENTMTIAGATNSILRYASKPHGEREVRALRHSAAGEHDTAGTKQTENKAERCSKWSTNAKSHARDFVLATPQADLDEATYSLRASALWSILLLERSSDVNDFI